MNSLFRAREAPYSDFLFECRRGSAGRKRRSGCLTLETGNCVTKRLARGHEERLLLILIGCQRKFYAESARSRVYRRINDAASLQPGWLASAIRMTTDREQRQYWKRCPCSRRRGHRREAGVHSKAAWQAASRPLALSCFGLVLSGLRGVLKQALSLAGPRAPAPPPKVNHLQPTPKIPPKNY